MSKASGLMRPLARIVSRGGIAGIVIPLQGGLPPGVNTHTLQARSHKRTDWRQASLDKAFGD